MTAVSIENQEKDLRSFEENACYNKLLQPMFTKEALSFLLDSSSEGTIYEIVDLLGVCASFFSVEGKLYLLGPYVKSEYSDSQIQSLLIENHLPLTYLTPFKLYYTSLPFVYNNQVQYVINSCIQSFIPDCVPYSYRRLSGFIQDTESLDDYRPSEATNYSEIYKRYDMERHFLSMIRNGDIEKVQHSFKLMTYNSFKSEMFQNSTTYTNPQITVAIIRALSRKAAEESGLSVITINEITQHYVQLTESARSHREQQEYTTSMILALTQAVHDFRVSKGKYSYPIQKTMEYIQFHLSEEIPLSTLAKNVNVSDSYLSKTFSRETGVTISSYIAKERCKKATEFLADHNLQIQEIGTFVGYSDNNYFVKVFKKIYGVTPSAYRALRKTSQN